MSLKKKLVFFIFMGTVINLLCKQKRLTVMLSPTGQTQDPGRKLLDGFERGATRQLAEILKKT